MRTKKSQGLSLTTVIVAALALVVLIILILIFSGRIAIFNQGVQECPPNSEPAGVNAECDGLPVKVFEDEDGNIQYCCKVDEGS